MSAFFKKLKSKAGESLVESLAAILIFTMASIILYTMVTTASDINMKAKKMDEKIQTELVAVEKAEASYKNGEGSISMTIAGQKVADVKVDIYGGQNDGELMAYFVQP